MIRKYPKIITAFTVLFLATACTEAYTTLGTVAYTYFQREDVNLKQKNYAAADYMEPQVKSYIDTGDLVRAKPLVNVGQPDITSEFAKKIPEMVGERFSQLGYNVDLALVLKPELSDLGRSAAREDFVLSGSYEKRRRDLLVTLQMLETSTNQVVGRFEYPLPLDGETRPLAEPQARIYRVDSTSQ